MILDQHKAERHVDVRGGLTGPTRSAENPRRVAYVLARHSKVSQGLAKDTEKLIRQLSLISYLMAERRPVTATEIRRDVEGYSDMTEDAFARRFYADRAELDALGNPPLGGQAGGRILRAGELLARARGVPPAADRVHRRRARRAADGADAARRRVRLRRAAAARAAADHLGAAVAAGLGLAADDRARDHRLGRRRRALARGWRRSTPRSTAASGSSSSTTRWSPTRPLRARSIRTTCSSRAGSSTSSATRTSATTCACSGCRGSAGRSPTRPRPSTTSSAPTTSTRAGTRTGSRGSSATEVGVAEVEIPEDLVWYVERQFGDYGTFEGNVFRTPYAIPRLLISWALEFGLRIVGPPALVEEARGRVDELIEAHRGEPPVVVPARVVARVRAGRRDQRARPRRRDRDPPGALRAARDAGDRADRRRPRAASGCGRATSASSCSSRRRSCARTSRS